MCIDQKSIGPHAAFLSIWSVKGPGEFRPYSRGLEINVGDEFF